MGVVAPASAKKMEKDHESAFDDNDRNNDNKVHHQSPLISYKTFVSWLMEKIRPETETDYDASDETSASDDAGTTTSTSSSSGATSSASSSSDSTMTSDNETMEEGGTASSSSSTDSGSSTTSSSSSTPSPPAEGMAETNESQKCSGFGCILKLNQRAKTIKCTPRNMTVLEKKREGATL